MPHATPIDFVALQEAVVGRYSLDRKLGHGGMAVVYLAHEVTLDRPLARKVLPPPFEGTTVAAILAKHLTEPAPPVASRAPGAPAKLADAIDRCLRKEPSGRFENAGALAEALALGSRVQGALPVPLRVFVRDMRELAPASPLIAGLWLVVASSPQDTRSTTRAWQSARTWSAAWRRSTSPSIPPSPTPSGTGDGATGSATSRKGC